MFTESAGIKIFSIDFIVIEASSIQNLIHFYLGIYSLIVLGYFSLISELQIIFRVFSHPWDPVAALCLCLFHEGRILFKKCECDRILLIKWEWNLIATSPISYTVSFSGGFLVSTVTLKIDEEYSGSEDKFYDQLSFGEEFSALSILQYKYSSLCPTEGGLEECEPG